MLDHVTIGVSDIERARIFYDQVLSAVGIGRLHAEGDFAGYGVGGEATIRATQCLMSIA